jgi:long-chain acyl-CoA synthetase
MPQPLEHRLGAEVLIDHAVVTGSNKPYCTALIFPSESALRTLAETYGLPSDRPLKSYFEHPRVVGRFQKLVDKANQGIERWSTIKRFTLLDEPLTVEGGLLTPTMKVKRSLLSERFADVIEAMYSNHETVPEQD